jgi:hypothetical protein
MSLIVDLGRDFIRQFQPEFCLLANLVFTVNFHHPAIIGTQVDFQFGFAKRASEFDEQTLFQRFRRNLDQVTESLFTLTATDGSANFHDRRSEI